MTPDHEVVLTVEEAKALQAALENYMRSDSTAFGSDHIGYRHRWNAADKALVPLRGGPFSNENRGTEPPKEPPSWQPSR